MRERRKKRRRKNTAFRYRLLEMNRHIPAGNGSGIRIRYSSRRGIKDRGSVIMKGEWVLAGIQGSGKTESCPDMSSVSVVSLVSYLPLIVPYCRKI
jgi:hypothetical protein